MIESQLRQHLTEKNIPWEDFLQFIQGQTFQFKNNEPYFYAHDIERFFQLRNGTADPNDWD